MTLLEYCNYVQWVRRWLADSDQLRSWLLSKEANELINLIKTNYSVSEISKTKISFGLFGVLFRTRLPENKQKKKLTNNCFFAFSFPFLVFKAKRKKVR